VGSAATPRDRQAVERALAAARPPGGADRGAEVHQRVPELGRAGQLGALSSYVGSRSGAMTKTVGDRSAPVKRSGATLARCR
jgi:hypothetical protein